MAKHWTPEELVVRGMSDLKAFRTREEVQKVHDYVWSKSAVGAENAIPAHELTALHTENDGIVANGGYRNMRVCAHWAPFYGIPLCSNAHGYFIAIRRNELLENVERLHAYVDSIMRRADATEEMAETLFPLPEAA